MRTELLYLSVRRPLVRDCVATQRPTPSGEKLGKQLRNVLVEWVDVRDELNFRAGYIEQIHCGYACMYTGQSSC